ncbi:hypothetical protein J5T34_05920 [Cupriavidus gilardii]|uniref:hypothetical protein n=1 Tax=Cupriavidus gilardii TaxID=82541 RepID=UPI001ABDD147|nr:hypothetical protein [Cupriavidus gilardii]MBO4120276.1 hypothetical protein [Cupriavidus gilardii]
MPDPLLHDVHLGNVAPAICQALKAPGCVVLMLNDNGTIGMAAHGVNHAKANELLSVGIHINLSQHDDLVAKGLAGPEAQAIEQGLRAEREGASA